MSILNIEYSVRHFTKLDTEDARMYPLSAFTDDDDNPVSTIKGLSDERLADCMVRYDYGKEVRSVSLI
jgi:hypothetical protein